MKGQDSAFAGSAFCRLEIPARAVKDPQIGQAFCGRFPPHFQFAADRLPGACRSFAAIAAGIAAKQGHQVEVRHGIKGPVAEGF
jgi:hypothetical protein